jgi:hypothetical protein
VILALAASISAPAVISPDLAERLREAAELGPTRVDLLGHQPEVVRIWVSVGVM